MEGTQSQGPELGRGETLKPNRRCCECDRGNERRQAKQEGRDAAELCCVDLVRGEGGVAAEARKPIEGGCKEPREAEG